MPHSPPAVDDVDILDLALTLWQDRFVITLTCLLVTLLGCGYIFIKTPIYESRISYSVHKMPPFYKKEEVFAEFGLVFFSETRFDDWKTDNAGSSLEFATFSPTEVVDGFVIAKSRQSRLAIIVAEKDHGVVVVRSDSLSTLTDFYSYAEHVNSVLTSRYVAEALEDKKTIEAGIQNWADGNLQTTLEVRRFLDSINEGAHVLAIENPTEAKKLSPRSALILISSVVFGGLIGVLYILFRNGIRVRREYQVNQGAV